MDIKVDGITQEIMNVALSKALNARKHILSEMNKVIKKPREDTKSCAPQMLTMQIDKSKIREVIGSGGKVIKDICEKSGAKVEIDDNGLISIFASKKEESELAKGMIDTLLLNLKLGKFMKARL